MYRQSRPRPESETGGIQTAAGQTGDCHPIARLKIGKAGIRNRATRRIAARAAACCTGLVLGLAAVSPLAAKDIELVVAQTSWELKPGLTTTVWSYNGTVPGPAISVKPGEQLVVKVTNKLSVDTNVHWHGIKVPNDQDGPAVAIAPGKSFTYRFAAPESGTFWYHSHQMPVLTQLDMGMYGAFIVAAPEDARYAGDRTFVLDDWYLDARGRRLEGTDRDGMERLGNIETVNGKTGPAIPALAVTKGEIHKLRFVNASAAAVHTLKIEGHRFRVTHLDGHPLTAPYTTDTLTLYPAERIDAELAATGEPGKSYRIFSADRDLGLSIPVRYRPGSLAVMQSPFVPAKSRAFAGLAAKTPDFTVELNSRMKGGAMQGMSTGATSGTAQAGTGHGSMHHGGSAGSNGMGSPAPRMDTGSAAMIDAMEWTMNGKAYPATDIVKIARGQVVKLRFINKDTAMGHPMDHPMHLHGTDFQVLAVNGKAPERETWKDTVAVPAGGTVDIAFRFDNPGLWMLHCHILDHEDRGMMSAIEVK